MILIPKNKQKRNQFFMTVAGVAILIGAMAFGLIDPQYGKLSSIRKQTVDTQTHYKSVEMLIREADAAAAQLGAETNALAAAESDMATGDIYAWTVDTIRHFKLNYKIEVPDIGQPTVNEVDIIPNFPYKQLKFTIRGSGYYHDIGKFIADFENKYPHMRVLNVEMTPAGNDTEKLSFVMDVVALMKSSS